MVVSMGWASKGGVATERIPYLPPAFQKASEPGSCTFRDRTSREGIPTASTEAEPVQSWHSGWELQGQAATQVHCCLVMDHSPGKVGTMSTFDRNSRPQDWDSCWLYCGKVSVHFGYADYGWVVFSLLTTARNGSLVVNLSEVFDPFWDMVDWLKAIADDQLPASFTVNEEGREKEFVVTRYTGTDSDSEFNLELQVFGGVWNHEAKVLDDGRYFITRVTKKQLLTEFCSRLETWLANDYQTEGWLGHNPEDTTYDLRNLDIAGLKEKVKAL